jgi:SAM-dependent methyltransferase
VKAAASPAALLGDTPNRDYSQKLRLFNAFAENELRSLIRDSALAPGIRILDAGCGTGETLQWLAEAIGPSGKVVGIDLAEAHTAAARRHAASNIEIMQGDLLSAALAPASFDFVWCVNTINHLRDPVQALEHLATLVRPGGRIALGQSSLVPDMYFAWDSRLERLTNEAVRRYYRDRYGLEERDLASVRAIVGALRASRLKNISVRTVMLERVSPLDAAAENYLHEAIFRGTWGERLRPYLPEDDYAELVRVCDPQHSQYALRRPDFHYLQSFSLATGEI